MLYLVIFLTFLSYMVSFLERPYVLEMPIESMVSGGGTLILLKL